MYNDHFAVYLKPAQYCKSTIPQLKKKELNRENIPEVRNSDL